MLALLRILDANANRVREALRVMEEAARFVLNREDLSSRTKQIRHDFAGAIQSIPALLANRDTAGDVGTQVTTQAEMQRTNIRAVVEAAGKRLSESLRAIEEYGKALPDAAFKKNTLESATDIAPAVTFAKRIEALRYLGYDLGRDLLNGLPNQSRQWRLCLLLTTELCVHHQPLDVLKQALEAGVDCVQVREKHMPDGQLLTHLLQVIELTQETRAAVIVNDRVDLALLSGADGVHLGQTDMPIRTARKLAGHHLIIGQSTENLKQADQAIAEGADYLGLGPMFTTSTKHKSRIAGPSYVTQFREKYPHMPHLAIGGINADNVNQVIAAGAQGVAVSSAICGAENPDQISQSIMRQFKNGSTV